MRERADDIEDPTAHLNRHPLFSYRNDPVGFCHEFFKEEYTDEIEELMESVRDNPITIAQSGNAVGKTHGAARVIGWWYLTHPRSKVFAAAAPPLGNLVDLLWAELLGLVTRPDLRNGKNALFSPDRVGGDYTISRHPLWFIKGVTIPSQGTEHERKSRFSGKHSPYLLFVLDEGDGIPAEVYEAIESCMSDINSRLLIMFNPHHKAGPVWEMTRKRQANVVKISELNHPNVVTGRDIIPGAVSRDVVVRRIVEWTRPLKRGELKNPDTSRGVFDPLKYPYLVGHRAHGKDGELLPPLSGDLRVIENAQFPYMVLAEYPTQSESQLISLEWVELAQQRWQSHVDRYGVMPPQGIPAVLGCDIGELGSDPSMVTTRYDWWVAPLEGWLGVDPLISAENIATIRARTLARICKVDSNGVGASVAPHLTRLGIPSLRVMAQGAPTDLTEGGGRMLTSGIGEFRHLKDELAWRAREWLRTDPQAALPPDDELRDELTAIQYEEKNGVIVTTPKEKLRDLLRRSPNKADSLFLTFAPERDPSTGRLITGNYLGYRQQSGSFLHLGGRGELETKTTVFVPSRRRREMPKESRTYRSTSLRPVTRVIRPNRDRDWG